MVKRRRSAIPDWVTPQIDDVEAAGERHGIIAEPSDLVEVALPQPDGAGVEQVDGGQDYHRVSMLAW